MRKPKPPQQPIDAAPLPPWLPAAVIALAALALLALFSTEVADTDTWWNLKTGQYVLAHRRLPDPDPFAWTSATARPANAAEDFTRRFNLTHEWLAQVLMYAVYAAGGFSLLVLWKALALTAVCALSGWVAARRTGSWLWGVAAALACASLLQVFHSDRPTIFTFLFVALFIAIFEHGRHLWLLPVLSLIWANCHGGFFLGWVVCAAASIGALRATPRADARRIWLASAATVLVSGLNPNGFRVLEALLLYRASPMQSTLIEWSKPYLWGPPYAFNILLYAAALTLLLAWRRVRLADWVLFAIFAAAALTAFRNIILMAILAPILIAAYFPVHLLPARHRIATAAPNAALALSAIALLWCATRPASLAFHAAEWRFPAGAADFLTAHRIQAPIFNSYEYGGYLLWRDHQVFIDGRALNENLFQDYRKILGSPPGSPLRTQTLDQHRIGAIVINGFEYVTGVLYPLALSLLNQPEWRLVYDDPAAMVFLRDLPAGVAELDKRRILDHLEAECSLHISRDPDYPLCARTLGDTFLRLGDPARARRALAQYLAADPQADTSARQVYQRLVLTGK